MTVNGPVPAAGACCRLFERAVRKRLFLPCPGLPGDPVRQPGHRHDRAHGRGQKLPDLNQYLDKMYLAGYIYIMKYRIETTKQYDLWFKKLKDVSSRIKILARQVRTENGKMKNDLGNKIF